MNAPRTISSLTPEQRRRAMVARDEGRREAYMRAYRRQPETISAAAKARAQMLSRTICASAVVLGALLIVVMIARIAGVL